MSRSVLLAAALSVPVFYALLEGEFLIILVAVIAGYVIHTLLGYWRLLSRRARSTPGVK